MEKHYSSPGFTLLLGSIPQYPKFKTRSGFYTRGPLVAFLYLVRQQGEGYILDDIGFSGLFDRIPDDGGFLTYLSELLENPEGSGTHVFNRKRYVIAAKECLQLYLCNHHKFSKGTTHSACRDKMLLRNNPWTWKVRLGGHSRIHKCRRYILVRQHLSFQLGQHSSFPEHSSEDEYCRCLSYRFALDALPFLLERSEVSLELAEILRGCTFAMMASRCPRRVRLAKEAIAQYLFRVESTVKNR